MKKQTWSIILCLILLIFLSLLFGKQNIHEGAETNSNVVIGQNLPSFFDNIMQDSNETTVLLDAISKQKNSLDQENQNVQNQIKASNAAIAITQSKIESIEHAKSNLLIDMIKKSHISEVVNLPLYTDAINKAEDLGISDPSNMQKQMNVNISGIPTNINYPIEKKDNKSCAFFKFDHNYVNDTTNSLYNYISFPFVNPSQFSFCIWIYINPSDSNYYTAASITKIPNWNPSLQLDIQGSSIMIYNSLPTQWNPVLRFTANPGWTHITYIYDAESNYKTSMYINGVLKSNANGSGTFMKNIIRSIPNYFIIGRSGDIGRGFNGYIRDFSYYAFVLPQKDILELYNKTL
jgi:hypothetical protein